MEAALTVRDFLRDGVVRNAVNFPSVHPDQLQRLQPWILLADRLGGLVSQLGTARIEALGVLMTDTCINYQTIMPPVRGEHVAYGDTGVVIYSNSVCGARSNFEGGPSALSSSRPRQSTAPSLARSA